MRLGERAAISGLLAETAIEVAVDLGTYRGGSLSLLTRHAAHVHTFDLTCQVDQQEFPNATFHLGDSHTLLPRALERIAAGGGSVGFAVVDGDHSPAGARQDVIDLLESPAVRDGYIVMHDAGNAAVRRGLLEVPYASYSKVALVDLGFVPPATEFGRLEERWGGLGLIVLDSTRTGPGATPERFATRRTDLLEPVIEIRRRARRAAGMGLRRVGMHPAQRRGRD